MGSHRKYTKKNIKWFRYCKRINEKNTASEEKKMKECINIALHSEETYTQEKVLKHVEILKQKTSKKSHKKNKKSKKDKKRKTQEKHLEKTKKHLEKKLKNGIIRTN